MHARDIKIILSCLFRSHEISGVRHLQTADLQTFVTNWKDYKLVLRWSEQRVLWSVLHDRVDNTLRSPQYILRDQVAWHK